MFNQIQTFSLLLSLFVALLEVGRFSSYRENIFTPGGTKGLLLKRTRRSVSSIFDELGKKDARYYQMQQYSFYFLLELLTPQLHPVARSKKRKRGKTPNGEIALSIRLSIALRYFACGAPLDLALVHGVSHTEVF